MYLLLNTSYKIEMDIKVSVIIPIYNVEDYLRECLESVFAQTLTEIEVICINDGSTDHSLDIIKCYEKRYSNLILINIENHGVGYARNLGIQVSKGVKCCFIDPDDKYPSKDVLEAMYVNAVSSGAFICGGSALILRDNILIDNPEGEDIKYRFQKDEIISFREYQWSYGFWRFLYDVSFLRENNILFPLYSRYQDPPFFVKAMICAKSFYAIHKATYIYRANAKPMVYTFYKTRDCLLGMIDVLRMTREEKLGELHRGTLRHIDTWLCIPLLTQILKGHVELLQLLEIARTEVDFDLIGYTEETYCFEVERRLEQMQDFKEKERAFLQRIRQFDNIIIYGAGFVGKKVGDYLLRLSSRPYINYAVTEKADNGSKEYNGIVIKCISDYDNMDKDKTLVLIATTNKFHEEINLKLIEKGYINIHRVHYEEFQYFHQI